MELKELGLKEIYLDLDSDMIGSFFAKEGELNSRGLILNILKNGVVANTTGIDMFMYALASDKKVYEKKADEIDISKGKYELIYPANMLKSGKIKVELRLKKGINNIATKTFILDVDKAIVSDNLIEGVDEPSLLEKLLEAGRNEEERIDNETVRISSEEDRELAEVERNTNELERVSNENVRVIAEEERDTNETARENNEDTRRTNEDIRLTNEVVRETDIENIKIDWNEWFEDVQVVLGEDVAGNLLNKINKNKSDLETHLAGKMPHLVKDDDTGKIYRVGRRFKDGGMQKIWEEVV